jgi:hypothetical protein
VVKITAMLLWEEKSRLVLQTREFVTLVFNLIQNCSVPNCSQWLAAMLKFLALGFNDLCLLQSLGVMHTIFVLPISPPPARTLLRRALIHGSECLFRLCNSNAFETQLIAIRTCCNLMLDPFVRGVAIRTGALLALEKGIESNSKAAILHDHLLDLQRRHDNLLSPLTVLTKIVEDRGAQIGPLGPRSWIVLPSSIPARTTAW